jgi:hypothetical protein
MPLGPGTRIDGYQTEPTFIKSARRRKLDSFLDRTSLEEVRCVDRCSLSS